MVSNQGTHCTTKTTRATKLTPEHYPKHQDHYSFKKVRSKLIQQEIEVATSKTNCTNHWATKVVTKTCNL